MVWVRVATGYSRRWKKIDDVFSRFDRIPVCDRRTEDG